MLLCRLSDSICFCDSRERESEAKDFNLLPISLSDLALLSRPAGIRHKLALILAAEDEFMYFILFGRCGGWRRPDKRAAHVDLLVPAQLARATVRDPKTGVLTTANYRVSKRYTPQQQQQLWAGSGQAGRAPCDPCDSKDPQNIFG